MDKRARVLSEGRERRGPVAYWMSRDQRAHDNWALLYAQQLARERRVPLLVVFCLVPEFLGAAWRHYAFMLEGLEQVARELEDHRIPFHLIQGEPGQLIPGWIKDLEVGLLVTDFDPLRVKRNWKKQVGEGLTIPVLEVDAHNIVPGWLASDKQEYAAYTMRPKIHRALEEFLTPWPALQKHDVAAGEQGTGVDLTKILESLSLDREVPPVEWLKPGEQAAREHLKRFLSEKLAHYDRDRNDPNKEAQSDLSPYLHFGHLAAQRVALEVKEAKASKADKEAFLEELIVRRELSDNYCYYNQNYDNFAGFPDWAQKTLNEHRDDEREYVYSRKELDAARTHDPLWNAAQLEMVHRGKMHGYLRMYWAKKILEWTASPEEAQETAIYLNDRYELDGRDPNGYVGVAWSVGGVHDRAWAERPVYGKIRYMSSKGAARKFDVEAYIDRQGQAAGESSP
ncbi:MAG: deoxyribodipyrimidine photo-lyase [Thermodesulfobacteriota bacterium]